MSGYVAFDEILEKILICVVTCVIIPAIDSRVVLGRFWFSTSFLMCFVINCVEKGSMQLSGSCVLCKR